MGESECTSQEAMRRAGRPHTLNPACAFCRHHPTAQVHAGMATSLAGSQTCSEKVRNDNCVMVQHDGRLLSLPFSHASTRERCRPARSFWRAMGSKRRAMWRTSGRGARAAGAREKAQLRAGVPRAPDRENERTLGTSLHTHASVAAVNGHTHGQMRWATRSSGSASRRDMSK